MVRTVSIGVQEAGTVVPGMVTSMRIIFMGVWIIGTIAQETVTGV